MRVAVVVPGIMGTELYLPKSDGTAGEKIWPPTAGDVVTGYPHIDDLQRDDLVVGDIIDKVSCFNFYNIMDKLLKGLNYSKSSSTRRQVDFPYDWRRDNFDTAAALADKLDEIHNDGGKEIYLLAHSMGGLVSRILLESGDYKTRPWFNNIELFSTFGTPHLGAPLALARIFGMDKSSGISGPQFAALAANRKYPSGYQLIPAPGEAAIWNLNTSDVAPLDPYDPTIATALGMDPVLVDTARKLHATLDAGQRPDHVRYFYYAGSGHSTVTRVNAYYAPGQKTDHSTSILTKTRASGDGTVPLYSALPDRGQRQIVVNKHATVFKGVPFRKVFYRTMGGNAGLPVEMIDGSTRQDGPLLQLSLEAEVYPVGSLPELVLSITDTRTEDGVGYASKLEGDIIINRRDDSGADSGVVGRIPIAYDGAPISDLTMLLSADLGPGLYALSFEGNVSSEDYEPFAVRDE